MFVSMLGKKIVFTRGRLFIPKFDRCKNYVLCCRKEHINVENIRCQLERATTIGRQI